MEEKILLTAGDIQSCYSTVKRHKGYRTVRLSETAESDVKSLLSSAWAPLRRRLRVILALGLPFNSLADTTFLDAPLGGILR